MILDRNQQAFDQMFLKLGPYRVDLTSSFSFFLCCKKDVIFMTSTINPSPILV